MTRWLLRLQNWAIPWLDRAAEVPGLRTIARVVIGEILAHNLRLILRHGQVRHLEHVETALRANFGDVADEMHDVLGDKADFVLKRDSEAWRETT